MPKFFLLISLFVLSINAFAQEEVAVLPVKYKSGYFSSKESLAISNSSDSNLVILVEDVEQTHYFLLNKEGDILSQVKGQKLDRKFKSFLGYSIEGKKYKIFFSNASRKKFGYILLDYDSKTVSQNFTEIDFGKEKYLTSVSSGNKFYILTGKKANNNISFNEYQDEGFQKRELSFDYFEFTRSDGFKKYACNLIKDIQIIDSNSPNAIELTSKKNKLYRTKNKVIFTDDNESNKTKTIIVDLDNFELENKEFSKPQIEVGEGFTFSHNSYYYKNILYQVSLNSAKMLFQAKSFGTGSVLKEFKLNKNDSITFKNGPIIQEGAPNPMFSDRVRKLEKTSKFLRKSHLGKTGVSAFKIGDKLQIQIGSYKEVKGGGVPMMGMPGFGGIPIASFGAVGITFNPMVAAYGTHTASKSTHISCVFDKGFNHIKGDPLDTIFDKIEMFEEEVKKSSKEKSSDDLDVENIDFSSVDVKLKNIFFHNGNHYFGYLDTQDRNYHLIKF